jgi:hypothetical protein
VNVSGRNSKLLAPAECFAKILQAGAARTIIFPEAQDTPTPLGLGGEWEAFVVDGCCRWFA